MTHGRTVKNRYKYIVTEVGYIVIITMFSSCNVPRESFRTTRQSQEFPDSGSHKVFAKLSISIENILSPSIFDYLRR